MIAVVDGVELEASGTGSPIVDDAPGNEASKWRGWLRETLETLLLAVVIWVAVNFATARFVVEGDSMEPNLHTGEFVIVSRLAYRLGEPQRGDVVVFHPPTNPGEEYIKRVVGLPGETVEIREGNVYINEQLLQEPYLITPTSQSGVWRVGPDEYFVMGDNRNNSDDSRKWGDNQLYSDLLVGKAWLIYWPPREWGVVPHQELTTVPALAAHDASPTATVVPPPLSVETGGAVEGLPEAAPVVATATEQSGSAPAGITGSQVVVTGTEGVGLSVRIAPGITEEIVFRAQDGEVFMLEGGPTELDGYVWWHIYDPNNPANSGWAAGTYLKTVP